MSTTRGSAGSAIAAAVIGVAVTVFGLSPLIRNLTFGRINTSAVIIVLVGIALLVWAYREWRRRPAPFKRRVRPAAQATSPAPTAPAVSDRGIDHPYLRLDLPSGWRSVDAPGDLFAMFQRQRSELDHAMLNVTLGHAPPRTDGRQVLQMAMDAHAAALARNHPRRMDPQPAEESVDGVVLQIVRTYICQADGPEWLVTARYATTTEPIGARGLPLAKPLIQITSYEQAWGGGDVGTLVRGATLVPLSRALGAPSRPTGPRYPYVVHAAAAAQRDEALVHVGQSPEGTRGLVALGYDLFLTVAVETPDTVQPQFPSDITKDGGTLDAWLREATDLLAREIGTAAVPVELIKLGGISVLEVGPTWKAAAAVASGAIYERAVRALGTHQLCALVPHRDRAFVFPEGPAEGMALFAAALLATEQAHARKPLSPLVFRLGRGGLSPLDGSQGGETLRPGDGATASGEVVTIRTRELAMRFPVEMPDRGTTEENSATCPDCQSPMKPVLITTGGAFGDRAIWEARPIAVDGWRCPRCEALTYPRVLSPERITDLIDDGVGHAQAGRLDDAEIALRRAASSWPGYPPPRWNLGSIYLDRVRAEQRGANRADVIERYLNEAERQLKISLANDDQPDFRVLLMLGRLLVKRGRRSEGAPLLERVVRDPQAPPAARAEAQSLL